jgi:hypothetical protein
VRIRRHSAEAQERARERREKEDSAPRLAVLAPTLKELRLEMEEQQADGTIAGTRHARLVVVATAAALFEVPCTDTSCKNGGHDLTNEIVYELKRKSESFSGESACGGELGASTCRRILKYDARAGYSE